MNNDNNALYDNKKNMPDAQIIYNRWMGGVDKSN